MAINRTNIGEHLVDYQFSIIGESKYTAFTNPNWKTKWTITSEQFANFEKYALGLIKKVFKCNSSKARLIFEEFISDFGLRIDDNSSPEEPERL